MKIIKYIRKALSYLFGGNKFWVYTYLAIIIKAIILLALACDFQFENISLFQAFISLPNLLVFFCFPAIVLSFGFLFKDRSQFRFLIILNFLLSFLFVIDLWNYRGFGDFISLHALSETANLNNLQDSVISMMRIYDIVLFIDLPFILYRSFKKKSLYKENKRKVASFAALIIVPLVCILSAHYILDKKHLFKHFQLFQTCWSPNQTISNLSPIGYHFYDTYEYWKESGPQVLTYKDKKRIKSYFEKNKENLPDNKFKGLFKGKNLILLQVESLEGFVINKKVNGQEITPNLNNLLGNSLYFTNFYEQVHNGTTSDAELMANTSLFPVRRGSTFFRCPTNTYNSLPMLFRKIGYSTTAIHPDKGAYWNWMKALSSFGFEKCIDETYFNPDEMIGLGISDETYFKQITPYFKKIKQPFYTFMITLTSHGPFNLPKKHRDMVLDKELEKSKLGGYFQSIHYTDKQIGYFIDGLRKEGLLNNTVIAIYGDHEGIHKYYQDDVDSVKPSEDWWLKNGKKTPLIIYQNNLNGEKIKTIGGQVDILPTIAYLMGIDKSKYEGTAIGRNLLNTKRNFVILDSMKYIDTSTHDWGKANAQNAIKISDMIIGSNYFKNYFN